MPILHLKWSLNTVMIQVFGVSKRRLQQSPNPMGCHCCNLCDPFCYAIVLYVIYMDPHIITFCI